MRNKALKYIFSKINKHPLMFIFLSLFLGMLFFLAFLYIPLKSDYIDLLPQNAEPVVNIKYLSKKLKGLGQFSLVVESKEKNIEGMKKLADKLNDQLKNVEELNYINYKVPESFKKSIFLFIDLNDLKEVYRRLHEKVQFELLINSPFNLGFEEEGAVEFNIDDIVEKYKNRGAGLTYHESEYFISKDMDILIMFLKPNFLPTNIEKTEQLINKINIITKNIDIKSYGNDLKISYGGTYILTYDQKNAINNDIKKTSFIALIIIFFVILLFIRNFRYSIFLFYSLFVGVLSAFGLAFIVFNHINLITGFLIAILTGLGVNYGIHFLFRYKEELNNGNIESALETGFIKTGVASLTGALTTACAFFTLSFSKFLGFSEFGLLASFGIMITLFSTYIFVSALIIFTNKIFKTKNIREQKLLNKDKSETSITTKKGLFYAVLVVILIITGILSYNIKNIKFEYNSKKLEVQGQESIKTTELIQKKFNISTDPAIFFTYDKKEEIDFLNTAKKMQKAENSNIGSIITISNILNSEELQKEKIDVIKKIQKEFKSLPENSIKDPNIKDMIKKAINFTKDASVISEKDLPEDFKKRFIFNDNGKDLYITQVFPNKVLFDAKEMKEYVNEIKTIKGEKRVYKPTGMHVIYVYLIDLVLNESRIFIIIVFIIIWLMLLIDFRNLKESVIAMIPLIFGVLWLLIIMSFFKVRFNFMNIIVLPTVLGTGVDNGVHIYHRYKETKNIFKALQNTGIANFAMSLTVALGWSSLFFAQYIGLRTMAFVGVAGILATFIASITVMPAIILIFDKKNNFL
ncbi:MAG: MMPL family transporter [Spirochaetes bacterium]|nr:MMPL family transporter [Spirochaetota bacterium]